MSQPSLDHALASEHCTQPTRPINAEALPLRLVHTTHTALVGGCAFSYW
jgi:hypothetical protein